MYRVPDQSGKAHSIPKTSDLQVDIWSAAHPLVQSQIMHQAIAHLKLNFLQLLLWYDLSHEKYLSCVLSLRQLYL